MHRVRWWLAASIATAIQLFGLYRPTGPPEVDQLPGLDKIAHVSIFAVPLLLILVAVSGLGEVRIARRRWLVIVGVFLGHAVLSEVIQGTFYRERTGDPLDVLADWAGVALGLGAFLLLNRRHSGAVSPEGEPEPAVRS
ncbi:hypothetical protein GCM10009841_28910 [Microlunatus panaciterrae]|uniref:VanZ family protein n=1 Tax=Microlunatus panaciterrae TaxID=400768 RepID=A0ABS2RH83_9ACTN|nr:VanZ family protein [Microlunatus panaciterrae]MBM7797551.1 VanZ family protein [Microlunatus panaciterrae]